jgi:FkbM family methyltransferase
LDSIDVGANIGDTIAAVDPRQGEWVMAVEPHPAYAAVLRRNAARFPAEIEVVEKACVDGSSPASVVVEATSGTGALRTVESGGLPTTTLDLLYEGTARMKGVRLLKVDVDGFDFTVLRGGGRFLAEVRPVVLMESDVFGNETYLEDLEELIARLKGCGYRDLVMYDNYGNLFSVLRLEGIEPLLPALFYQATAGKIYYDLVFGVDLGDFISSELAHFQASARDETRRRVGGKIARRWSRERTAA